MKTLALAAVFATVFCATQAHAENGVPTNPDASEMKLAPPHLVVQFGAGASVSSVDAGDVHYISEHAHFDLAVGHEVFAGPLGTDRFSFGVAYAGSADVSADEILHRHGFGLTFRKSWLFATISGGVSFLHGFGDGTFGVGGHFGLVYGVKLGPVQIAMPIYVDAFALPITTFGLTLGFQL